jgi:hypothetical protein
VLQAIESRAARSRSRLPLAVTAAAPANAARLQEFSARFQTVEVVDERHFVRVDGDGTITVFAQLFVTKPRQLIADAL